MGHGAHTGNYIGALPACEINVLPHRRFKHRGHRRRNISHIGCLGVLPRDNLHIHIMASAEGII